MSVFFSQSPDDAAQAKTLQDQNSQLEKEKAKLKRQLEELTTVTTAAVPLTLARLAVS